PPESDDICWHGVCVYGNFDMGLIAEPHGNPFNSMAGGPMNYIVEKASWGAQAGVAANLLSTSFIGLRGKQEIGDNLYAVFNLQTLFNPASGQNANQLGGFQQNAGLGQAGTLGNLANSYGDSSKGGQMFNNVAYFGISSPTYGTFTMGRQSSLTSDLMVNYDALSGSNAWSLITFEGATGGGGDTEDRIYDNSYEYRLNIGPMRFAAIAQLQNGGNSATNNTFEGDIGFDYMGFSMDFIAGHIANALALPATLTTAQVNNLITNQGGGLAGPGYAIPCSLGCQAGIVSDNTVFSLGAKYTIGQWKFYGGYEHVTYQNPNNPLQPGAFMYAGYNLAFVNNDFYASNKNLNVFWIGAKYAVTPTLDLIGAYYGQRAGFFTQGTGTPSGAGGVFATIPGQSAGSPTQAASCAANSASFAGCAGGTDMVSFAVDWRFARHVDLFAGVAWEQKFGGFVNGYNLSNNNGTLSGNNVNTRVTNWDPGIGLRYQF
ncbi:MAG TPA: porin, partial [Bradyrhizobium sp.]|nr:porin [Bradyrhizobium sp.]